MSETPESDPTPPSGDPPSMTGCILGVGLPLIAVYLIAQTPTQDQDTPAEPKEPFSIMDAIRDSLGTAKEESTVTLSDPQNPVVQPIPSDIPAVVKPEAEADALTQAQPQPAAASPATTPLVTKETDFSAVVFDQDTLNSSEHVYNPNSKAPPTAAEFIRYSIDETTTALARKAFQRVAEGSRVEWMLQLVDLDENEAGQIVGNFSLPYLRGDEHTTHSISVSAKFPPEQEAVLVALRSKMVVEIRGTLRLSADGNAATLLENASLMNAPTAEAPEEPNP